MTQWRVLVSKMQGKVGAGTSWVVEDNEMCFGNVEFQILVGHEGGDVQKVDGHAGLELKGEVKAT